MKLAGLRRLLQRLRLSGPQARAELGLLRLFDSCSGLFFHDPWLRAARDLHAGERCFILGNGPSLNKTDLSRISGEVSFGTNGIFLAEDIVPTYYVTISATYWQHHVEEIRRVACRRRFLPSDTRALESSVPTSWLPFRRPSYHALLGGRLPVPRSFSTRPDKIVFGGGTVLFVCLQLAYYMGFETAVILGVDHSYGKGRGRSADKGAGSFLEQAGATHFSNKYHAKGERFHVDLEAMEHAYELANLAFRAGDRQIWNASPGSQLETFPKVSYDALFDSR